MKSLSRGCWKSAFMFDIFRVFMRLLSVGGFQSEEVVKGEA